MKRKALISMLIVFCMLISMLAVNVSATISVNDGKGQLIPLTGFQKSAGITNFTAPKVQNDTFGEVYRMDLTASSANVKVNFNFDLSTAAPGAAVGDKVHLKYYMRSVKPDDTYAENAIFYPYNGYGGTSGKQPGSKNVSSEWQLFEYNSTITAVGNSWRFVSTGNTSGSKYAYEIAGVELFYYNADATQEEIDAELAKSDITAISLGGTPIDLNANPTSYTTTGNYDKNDIVATAYHSGKEVEITSQSSGNNTIYTLTSYAPNYDLLTKTGNKSTYTITVQGSGPAPEVKGTYIPSTGFQKASGTSAFSDKTRQDDTLGEVHTLDWTASAAAVKINFNFDLSTVAPAAAVGDKVHIKFYMRNIVPDASYTANTGFYPYPTYGATSGNRPAGWQNVSSDWQLFECDTTISAVGDSWRFVSVCTSGKKYAFEIAGVELFLYDSDATQEKIDADLAKAEITSVTVADTDVDLGENPSSYTTSNVVVLDDVSATSYHEGRPVGILQNDNDDKSIFTITSYAPDYNLLTNTGNKAVYTVTGTRAVVHLLNNDIGYAVIANDGNETYGGTAGLDNVLVEKVKNEDITASNPFAEYYTWQVDQFEEEGQDNASYIRIMPDQQPGVAPEEGGYVYVSFYYRAHNRFENQSGQTVDGAKWRLYPSVTVGEVDSPYIAGYSPSTGNPIKYFDANVNTGAASDVQDWKRVTWIQPLEGGEGNMSFKLSQPLTKNTESGTVKCDNRSLDIAQVELIYFGVPTGTTDNQKLIDEKIDSALNSFELASVLVDGTDVLGDYPGGYEEMYKLSKPSVKVSNKWGTKFVNKVSVSDVETNYIAYAPAYDWLNTSDIKRKDYTISLTPALSVSNFEFDYEDAEVVDFSTFGSGKYTIKFEVDNASDENLEAVAIFAAYNEDSLINIGQQPVSPDALDSDYVSIDLNMGEDTTSFMVFLFDGFNNIMPIMKAKTIDANGIN